VRLHPNLAQVYRQKVEELQRELDDSEIRVEAVQILRGLVEYVSIGPAENGLEIEIAARSQKWSSLALEPMRNRPTLMRD
jgi:hypothetical protein